jgi:hypothetical protein
MIRPYEHQLRELQSFEGRGARILSLYLRTSPAAGDAAALREQVYAVSRGLRRDMSEAQQVDLEADLDVVRDYLGSMVAPPPAVALFTCARRHFFRVVRLPCDVQPEAQWDFAAETGPLRRLAERAAASLEGHALEDRTLRREALTL